MPLLAFLGNVLKKKVSVPDFKPIDPNAVESQGISDFTNQLPAASAAATQLNAVNQAAMNKQIEGLIPGFSNIASKVASNISSEVSGQLPSDVIAQIMRASSEKAVAGGFAGSESARNLTARDIGLNSLQLTDAGLRNAASWLQSSKMRAAPLADAGSFFLPVGQRLGLSVSERDKTIQRDYLANQLKAAQSWRTYMGQALGQADSLVTGAASSYMGGGMKGGGSSGGVGYMGGGAGPSASFNPSPDTGGGTIPWASM